MSKTVTIKIDLSDLFHYTMGMRNGIQFLEGAADTLRHTLAINDLIRINESIFQQMINQVSTDDLDQARKELDEKEWMQ